MWLTTLFIIGCSLFMTGAIAVQPQSTQQTGTPLEIQPEEKPREKRQAIIQGCPDENFYQCPDSDSGCNCHNIHSLCDGIQDCDSGIDEDLDFCKDTCKQTTGWWCPTKGVCIHRLNMCDESNSCGGRSEKKKNCKKALCPEELGYYRCEGDNSRKQCVRKSDLCDDNISPCTNGWLPTDAEVCNSAPTTNLPTTTTPATTTTTITTTTPTTTTTTITTTTPPTTTTTPPTTTTTTSMTTTVDMYDGVFVDCEGIPDLTRTYSGSAIPVRSVGDINGGVSICEAALYTHNKLRANHENTPHMTYNNALAAKAEEWSIYLANSGAFEHSSSSFRNGAGENLYYGASSGIEVNYGVTDAAYAWYIEMEEAAYNFDTGNGNGGVIGHFTQMVWDDSARIGCGVASINRGGWLYVYVTCHYDPPGNYIGQYADHVQQLIASPHIPVDFWELELQDYGCIERATGCNDWASYCDQYGVVRDGCPLQCYC